MDEIARNVDRILVMKSAQILMDGTPPEVFSRSEELLSAGLDIPHAARIAIALRRRGLDIPPDVYTVDALEREILRLRKETVPC